MLRLGHGPVSLHIWIREEWSITDILRGASHWSVSKMRPSYWLKMMFLKILAENKTVQVHRDLLRGISSQIEGFTLYFKTDRIITERKAQFDYSLTFPVVIEV